MKLKYLIVFFLILLLQVILTTTKRKVQSKRLKRTKTSSKTAQAEAIVHLLVAGIHKLVEHYADKAKSNQEWRVAEYFFESLKSKGVLTPYWEVVKYYYVTYQAEVGEEKKYSLETFIDKNADLFKLIFTQKYSSAFGRFVDFLEFIDDYGKWATYGRCGKNFKICGRMRTGDCTATGVFSWYYCPIGHKCKTKLCSSGTKNQGDYCMMGRKIVVGNTTVDPRYFDCGEDSYCNEKKCVKGKYNDEDNQYAVFKEALDDIKVRFSKAREDAVTTYNKYEDEAQKKVDEKHYVD